MKIEKHHIFFHYSQFLSLEDLTASNHQDVMELVVMY